MQFHTEFQCDPGLGRVVVCGRQHGGPAILSIYRVHNRDGRRTVVPAGVSGREFQLEIAAQSSSRIFVELDWAADRKLD